jgi:hypothetical protein
MKNLWNIEIICEKRCSPDPRCILGYNSEEGKIILDLCSYAEVGTVNLESEVEEKRISPGSMLMIQYWRKNNG